MEDEKSLMDLFLHKKPVGILLSLKDSEGKYASILAKETDCTYTHALKILSTLEEHSLVDFKKEGRIKEVMLTDLGADIAHDLEGVVRRLERLPEDRKKEEEAEEEEE